MSMEGKWGNEGKDEHKHSAYLSSLPRACASVECQKGQCCGQFQHNVPQMSVSLGTRSQDTDIAVLWATGLKSLELVDALA